MVFAATAGPTEVCQALLQQHNFALQVVPAVAKDKRLLNMPRSIGMGIGSHSSRAGVRLIGECAKLTRYVLGAYSACEGDVVFTYCGTYILHCRRFSKWSNSLGIFNFLNFSVHVTLSMF